MGNSRFLAATVGRKETLQAHWEAPKVWKDDGAVTLSSLPHWSLQI